MTSRGERTQRRAAERADRSGPRVMAVPSRIAGMVEARRSVRPPCPIDPACRVDHLKRKGRS